VTSSGRESFAPFVPEIKEKKGKREPLKPSYLADLFDS
jgi:hypothetical protein